jgi:hypothetical protein
MSALSEEIFRYTVIYMGPASRVFLERITKAHLKGLPLDDLQKGHLPELAKWVEISAGLVIDKKKAELLARWILSRG